MTSLTASTPTRSNTRGGNPPGNNEEELKFAFAPPATTMTVPNSLSFTGSSSPDSSDVDLPRCSDSEDSFDDTLNDCSPCSRGNLCRQLQRVVSLDNDDEQPLPPRVLSSWNKCGTTATGIPICSPENSPSPKAIPQQHSCVDCGGCLTCCDCSNAVPTAAAEDDAELQQRRRSNVRSINLGAIDGIGVLDRQLSSTALTLAPSSESLRMPYSLEKTSSLVVRTIIDEEDDTRSATQMYAEGQETTDETKNHKSHELPRHDEFGDGFGAKWNRLIHHVRNYTTRALLFFVHYAAVYPKTCVVSCFCFSWFILIVGFFTNFEVQVENWYLWPPRNSLSTRHTEWFYFQSEFNYETSYFDMVVHANGENVLGMEGVRRTFEAIEAVRNIDGYKEGCQWVAMFGAEYHLPECKIHSVADFWNESLTIFEQQVSTDQDAVVAMSARSYPNGVYVDESRVLGNAKHVSKYGADDDTFTILESAQAYLIEFDLPWTNVTEDFEWDALQRIRQLQEEWNADPTNKFTIQYESQRSFGDEFLRSIIKDMPLLPFVFVIMALFCCFVFWKRDRVQSRMLVGIGAVVCICLSVITGYGVLFCCGVPFTTVTTMMPFLMFGVGLDDSFIIWGFYDRLDRRLDPYERIRLTFEDVGLSITFTTLTSAVAFMTGCFSSIPAVSWVCWYAWPTILIDFFYQITFFISLIILDEQRIAANRLDICFWATGPTPDGLAVGDTFEETESPTNTRVSASSDSSEDGGPLQNSPVKRKSRKIQPVDEKAAFADRFMHWFAKKLLLRKVQVFVGALFLFILMGSICATTRLHQKFNYVDMVPGDSYMKDYFLAMDEYTHRNGIYTYVFFRDVDQSDPAVQDSIMNYVEDLANSGAIAQYPVYFWLNDFLQHVHDFNDILGDLTFEEQILAFFKVPGFEDLYGEHVAYNKTTGEVWESRCVAYVDVDLQDTKDGSRMLNAIRTVDARQPINNDGRERWAFFTYADDYHMIEFYNRVVNELISNTIMTIASVSFLALVFMPHWTAVLYVFPFLIFLYLDMLGWLYIADVQVNAISYITLVMSIGLMVDYLVHVLLRFLEAKGTREQRMVETLSTMGASILVGAISTFLGVMLLAFSTSVVINNIFVAFIGLVTFGVLHGLIFLPTLLAIVGPECSLG